MPSRHNVALATLEEKVKPWQPESWVPRHNLVVQLHALGFPNKEIAEITNYTESRVSQIINDPRAKLVVQETLETISGNITDLHTRLKVHAVEALDEIVTELRHSRDERIRQKAAFGLLDRAGYTPVHKQIVVGGSIGDEVAGRIERAHAKLDAIDAEYDIITPEEEDGDDEAS